MMASASNISLLFVRLPVTLFNKILTFCSTNDFSLYTRNFVSLQPGTHKYIKFNQYKTICAVIIMMINNNG